MPSTICRAFVGITAGLAIFVSAVAAQSALSAALSDLARYLAAATSLIASAALGLREVNHGTVPAGERASAVKELRSISVRIETLTQGQQVLIGNLSDYTKSVRAHGYVSAGDSAEWNRILGSIRRISAVVGSVLRLVETSRWLKVTLSEEDRAALESVLKARQSLLAQLEDLPVPGSGSLKEIDQLDDMNARYLELHKALRDLNQALTRAADILAGR